MHWDEAMAVWRQPSPQDLNVDAVTSIQPQLEFDEIERNIILTISKKLLLQKSSELIVSVNAEKLPEIDENWFNDNDSSSTTYVFPCEEIFGNRQYEENVFFLLKSL